ncbi:hypothetical protein HYY75_08260 [bacterium]|nr:hypothetical protein [bacterium]
MTLNFNDFVAADGLEMTKSFDDFASEWLGKQSADPKNKVNQKLPIERTIFHRICRKFPDEKAFKDFTFSKDKNGKPRMMVDGVVRVEGNLNLDKITMDSKSIKGGIIIVNGNITLNEITRGITDFGDSELPSNQIFQDILKLPQESFLTFVCLSDAQNKRKISLKGNNFLGVQLICLSSTPFSSFEASRVMLEINPTDLDKRVKIFGGVAVSTPNMRKQTRNLKNEVCFYYIPTMSDPNPSVAAYVSPQFNFYQFYGVMDAK